MCSNSVQDVYRPGVDSNVLVLPSEVGSVNNAGQKIVIGKLTNEECPFGSSFVQGIHDVIPILSI
jgi:hypothetical protein